MKLVEILARELNEWPEGADCARQSDCTLEMFFYGEGMAKYDRKFSVQADDAGCAEVTLTQWQAERERIKKIAEDQKQFQVEWVANEAIKEFLHQNDIEEGSDQYSLCFVAAWHMSERAKRLHKG